MIYLDNAATTQMHEYVVREMLPYLYGDYGNPGAIYKMGRTAQEAVRKARKQVADFLHTTPEHIVFTSGGSEGNNMVLRGLADHLKENGKTTIVTTPIEHSSVLRVMDYLIKLGFDIRYLPVSTGGSVDISHIEDYIDDTVGLFSVMYVNNETGAVNQIKEIAQVCDAHGILFHSDCVQAAAAFDIDVEDIGVAFITMSAHKIHGPKGVGAIYIRDLRDTPYITPLVIGGKEQEGGLRGGTENVPGIVGFGKACELMKPPEKFRSLFLYELSAALADLNPAKFAGIYVNGTGNIANTILNIEVQGVDAETLILLMDVNGVAVSAGSACHSHSIEPSHVLKAMGLSDSEARSSVRISASSFQTEKDIVDAAHIMAQCICKLVNLNAEHETQEET